MKDPRPLVILAEERRRRRARHAGRQQPAPARSRRSRRARPGFGHRRIQHLGDLAAFTGGTVIAEEAGLSLANVRREHFGTRAAGDRHRRLDDVRRGRRQRRGRARRGCRRSAPSWPAPSHERDVEIMQERIARLASQLAVIKVGAPTDTVLRGAPAAHRGRAGGDAGRRLGGDRPRRRHRAAAQRRGARRPQARGRLRARRRGRPQRARRAAVLDRLQRRLRRPRGRRPGAGDARGPRARRAHRRVRRPVREGRRRPGPVVKRRASSTPRRWRRCC